MARSTKPLTRSKCGAADLRADIGRLVARIALLDLLGLFQEGLDEAVADALLDQDARAGEADLAGIVELADRRVDRKLEIAIGKDDEGRFAAEFEGERHQIGRLRPRRWSWPSAPSR